MNQGRPVTDRLDHRQAMIDKDRAHALTLCLGGVERVVLVEPGEDAAKPELARARGHGRGELVDVVRKQVPRDGESHDSSE